MARLVPVEDEPKKGARLVPVDRLEEGAAQGNLVRGPLNALQGPTLGFLDELAGVGSALTGELANLTPYGDGQSFLDNYRSGRDFVRGANKSYRQEYPIIAPTTQIAAAAPTFMWNPGATTNAVGPASQILQAAKVGGVTGTIQGAGDSEAETLGGVVKDAAKSGAASAATGSVFSGTGQVLGAVGSNIAQRVSNTKAAEFAKQKIAEALLRDGRTIGQTEARLRTLGPRAVMADAGGENTKSLLDVLTVLPGETKEAASKVIRDRVGSRGQHLYDTAADLLSPAGKTLAPTLKALDEQKLVDSAPFYQMLQGRSVRVDDGLKKLLDRSKGNFGKAQELYRVQTGNEIDLSKINVGDDVPFTVLDSVKQALYDAGSSAKRSGENALGGTLDDVRRTLISKLDDLSPKNKNGESVYKLARDAYAGPSQLRDAAELGYTSVNQKAFDVSENIANLSKSELEAFKVGVLQGVREKVGTQSGQTQVLNMWKEISTQDKLKNLFGGSYRKFAAEVAKESRLKGLEKVGQGSQTMPRQFAAGDLDMSAVSDAAGAAGAVTSGNPVSMLTSAANLWNRVKTPESVRNEMGNMLLLNQKSAQQLLPNLQTAVDDVTRARLQRSNLAGGWAGLLAPDF